MVCVKQELIRGCRTGAAVHSFIRQSSQVVTQGLHVYIVTHSWLNCGFQMEYLDKDTLSR